MAIDYCRSYEDYYTSETTDRKKDDEEVGLFGVVFLYV